MVVVGIDMERHADPFDIEPGEQQLIYLFSILAYSSYNF